MVWKELAVKKKLQADVIEAHMASMLESNNENGAIPAFSDITSDNYYVLWSHEKYPYFSVGIS